MSDVTRPAARASTTPATSSPSGIGRLTALRHRLPGVALDGGVALIYLFLYLPAIVIAVYSFSASSTMTWPIDGLTFDWYRTAFADQALMEGLRNTLLVAVVSTIAALILGVPAGFALDRFDFPGKALFQRTLMAPFLVPGVVSGMALLSLFLELDVDLSLTTVIATHTTMLLGVFVILTVVTLQRWDRSYEQAAMDLGANELRTFWHVVLPNMRGALAGAALLGLTVSLDEITRTFFVTGTENTLPMVVMSRLRTELSPEINAIGTTVIGISLLGLLLWSLLFRKRAS